MNIHQNARLTPQGRLLLVERITESGWENIVGRRVLGEIRKPDFLWNRWSRNARSNDDAGSVRSRSHAYCSS
jgi:hypothetical protein